MRCQFVIITSAYLVVGYIPAQVALLWIKTYEFAKWKEFFSKRNRCIAVHVIRLRLLFYSLFHGSITLAFYRCGHCKKLAPEYEKLGSSFNKAKSVLIGKVSVETSPRLGFFVASCCENIYKPLNSRSKAYKHVHLCTGVVVDH